MKKRIFLLLVLKNYSPAYATQSLNTKEFIIPSVQYQQNFNNPKDPTSYQMIKTLKRQTSPFFIITTRLMKNYFLLTCKILTFIDLTSLILHFSQNKYKKMLIDMMYYVFAEFWIEKTLQQQKSIKNLPLPQTILFCSLYAGTKNHLYQIIECSTQMPKSLEISVVTYSYLIQYNLLNKDYDCEKQQSNQLQITSLMLFISTLLGITFKIFTLVYQLKYSNIHTNLNIIKSGISILIFILILFLAC